MIKNKYIPIKLKNDDEVNLYHLGINEKSKDLRKIYNKIKVVVMGGKDDRMKLLAHDYHKYLHGSEPKNNIVNLAESGGRYFMSIIDNVIFLSHGMGVPSISIALHEIAKLLHYSGVENAVIIRVGSCGGLGIEPGTVIVTNKSYNTKLTTDYELYVCGKLVTRPSNLDSELRKKFLELAHKLEPDLNVIEGNTMCAMDFYEEQARVDGAINEISEEDKMDFLHLINKKHGIMNIEMECVQFGAFCHKLGIRGMVVAQSMLDRLKGDKVTPDYEMIKKKENKFFHILYEFIKEL